MPGDVLSPEQRSALDQLIRAGVGSAFYLAGGIGLALRLGHRRSKDFDFFTPHGDPVIPLRDRLLRIPGFHVNDEREGTMHATLLGVGVTFLNYPYPLLQPPDPLIPGVPVASLPDIAAMKLSAIVARGRRRDFVDLHAICGRIPLAEALDAFRRKAGAAYYNPQIIAKALVYFIDAEKDAMPDLLVPVAWDDVKRFFEGEVRRLLA
jgi:hypothetical protein